jgi:hypothetical protein
VPIDVGQDEGETMTRVQGLPYAKVHRSKWFGALALFLPLCGICATGCAAETMDDDTARIGAERPHFSQQMLAKIRAGKEGLDQPLTDAQRAQVLAILRTQGRKLDGAIFYDEDVLVIETDIIVDGRAVLRDGGSEQKKGRWSQNWDPMYAYNVTGYNVVNVVANGGYLNADWESAFEEAMAEYANRTNVYLTSTPPMTPRSTIWVGAHDFGWQTGFTAWTVPNGDIDNPGAIELNTTFSGTASPSPCWAHNIYNLPHWVKVHIALHELGHALGFAHYDDGTYIGGTTDIYPDGPYATVMTSEGCLNGTMLDTLSNNDVDMVNIVYWTY